MCATLSYELACNYSTLFLSTSYTHIIIYTNKRLPGHITIPPTNCRLLIVGMDVFILKYISHLWQVIPNINTYFYYHKASYAPLIKHIITLPLRNIYITQTPYRPVIGSCDLQLLLQRSSVFHYLLSDFYFKHFKYTGSQLIQLIGNCNSRYPFLSFSNTV